MSSCGVGRHTVDKVNDTDYRCWRCGADEGVMEREEEDALTPDQPAYMAVNDEAGPATSVPVPAVPHGTDYGYSRHKCRCPDCTQAHATYIREWRQKHGSYDVVAQRRATREAARRYREHYPKAWARLLRAETEKARAETCE